MRKNHMLENSETQFQKIPRYKSGNFRKKTDNRRKRSIKHHTDSDRKFWKPILFSKNTVTGESDRKISKSVSGIPKNSKTVFIPTHACTQLNRGRTLSFTIARWLLLEEATDGRPPPWPIKGGSQPPAEGTDTRTHRRQMNRATEGRRHRRRPEDWSPVAMPRLRHDSNSVALSSTSSA
jgi:hypothetical protein